MNVVEQKIDYDNFKRTMNYLQWRFEQKFDKPPSKQTVPKKEHLCAFYNFYDEVFTNTDNHLEKYICINQKKNIVNLFMCIYKLKEHEFLEFYKEWCENKSFPKWD